MITWKLSLKGEGIIEVKGMKTNYYLLVISPFTSRHITFVLKAGWNQSVPLTSELEHMLEFNQKMPAHHNN